MEVLGGFSSAISLLQLAERLREYVEAAYKSEEEKVRLKNELDNLSVKLKQLEVQEENARKHPDDPRYDNFRAILQTSKQFSEKDGPDRMHKEPGVLDGLRREMAKTASELAPQHGFKARARRLRFHHDRKKFEEKFAEIRRWTASVDSILIVDTLNSVRTIEDKIDHSTREKERKALEKRRIAIITWLSSLRFRERQSALLNQMQGRLLNPSLLMSEEFAMWKEGRPWILHCQGMPGSGKTLLCAATVQHLAEVFRKQDIPVLYMFLSYKERYHQSLDNLIASLLKQLIQKDGSEFRSSEAKRLYQGAENESRPSLDKFFEALCAEIQHHERVFIVVDALDEAAPNIRPELLDRLYTLVNYKASVMLTSQRPEDGVRATYVIECNECKRAPLKVYLRCPICENGSYHLCQSCINKGVHCKDDDHVLTELQEVLIDIEPPAEQIMEYVIAELEAEEKLGFSGRGDNHVSTFGTTPLGRILKSQPGLKNEILNSVVAKANGMFALAGLYMNSLRSLGLSEAEILDMLEKPPEGYSGFYEQHMERICAVGQGDPFGHGASLGRRVLSWVFSTKRVMSLAELQDALAVDLRKPGLFNPAARYDKATIVSVTAGLVTIDNIGMNGNEAVRLNHLSAQQYFDENQDRWFPNVSAEISRVALHYMSLPPLAKPCENIWEDKEFEMRKVDYPFLEYAYPFWGDHAAEAGSDPAVQTAVMQFVSDPNKVAAFIQAAWYLRSDATAEWDVRKGANGLHVTAWFGLTHAVSGLIDQGVDVDSRDPTYAQTALMYACRRGQTATVGLLLERGANLNMLSNRGSCAIHEAVSAGNLDVLKVLLANPKIEVNIPHLMKSGMTPLAIAAQDDRSEIASALLSHNKINLDLKDFNEVTALSCAIRAGSIEVAMRILDCQDIDLDLDSKNSEGSTALSLAAENGMNDLVDMLLSKGADPSITDKQDGGTAILRAIDGGSLATVEIMLKHGVDINCVDDQDRGLLHGAAIGGWDEIVQLLLDNNLDPNSRDKKRKTPLHDASRGDYFTTVQILLDHGATRRLKDSSGRTPWTVAWQNGHTRVLKVLELRNPQDTSEYDRSGEYPNAKELPVWSLASLGQKELVALAIAHRRNEISFLDPDTSNTALHCAVLKGEFEIVQMLLSVGMSVDARNDYFRTPLHLAAINGNLEIVRALLEIKGVDEDAVNSGDRWRTPPIVMAYSNWHPECCLLLIEAGATLPASKQAWKQQLFFLAIEYGRLNAVINLVNMGADVQAKNVLGLTGIQLAQDGGKTDVENYLRKNKSVWVNSMELEGATPDEMMASMTLKQSPFHRPEVWTEKEEEKREDLASSVTDVRTGQTHLHQLTGLNAPQNLPRSNDSSKEAGLAIEVQEKSARVPQLA